MKALELSDENYEKRKDKILKEEKKIHIKNRFTGQIIYSSSKTTMKEAVEDANLEDAYLEDAYLEDVNLKDAYLKGAYLKGAYMENINLKGVNLEDGSLEGAYLKDAYMENINLKGVNLKDADFFHAKFYGKGGKTKITKSQIPDFFKALGVIVEG